MLLWTKNKTKRLANLQQLLLSLLVNIGIVIVSSNTASSSQPASPSLRRSRVLQFNPPETSIELISNNVEDKTVTVRVRQTFFNNTNEKKCGSSAQIPDDVVMTMFAIYNNAQASGEPYCNFYYQKDACFSDDIVVACDPKTNKATVELIARDTFHLSKRFHRIVNPKVKHINGGTCVGPLDTVGNAISLKRTFDCKPDDIPCVDNTDCPSHQWCSEKYDHQFDGGFLGTFCKNFVTEGEPCSGGGGFIPPGLEDACAPPGSISASYLGSVCRNKIECTGIVDGGGICDAILKSSCTTNNDCNNPTTEYCDKGKCFAKLSKGDCCTPGSDEECSEGLSCTLVDDQPFGEAFHICQ